MGNQYRHRYYPQECVRTEIQLWATTAEKVAEQIRLAIDNAPEHLRKTAIFIIETHRDYEEEYHRAFVQWHRPKTDEEKKAWDHKLDMLKSDEYKQYVELRKKFESL